MTPIFEPPCADPSSRLAAPSAGARILIADDEADCRDLLVLALRGASNEIAVATNGGELLEQIAERGPFDLIVTDINMPWMRGLHVLASVREAGLRTPVLVVTGLCQPDLPTSIARLGRAKLLYKPFAVGELREAIAELLAVADLG